jgi:hypothetical protein
MFIPLCYGKPHKATWTASVILGICATVWHITNMVFFFIRQEWSDLPSALVASWLEVILWWLVIPTEVLVIVFQIQILLTKGVFLICSPEMIQEIE